MNNLKDLGEFTVEEKDLNKINKDFCAESMSSEETAKVIKEIYNKEGVLIDPHTAVAIGAASKLSFKENTVVLSTAHPSKFFDIVMKETGVKPELPEKLKKILVKKEKFEKLPNDLEKVKNYIMSKVQ